MSHFTVTVCLDDSSGQLARAIAIAQQDASPGGFLYQVIGQRVGTALAPFDENTEVAPRRDYEDGDPEDHLVIKDVRRDAEQAACLPARASWADVVRVHNDRYGDEDRMYLDKDGRAYTMTTYNPKSKWDWWQIGGRWTGQFPYKREHAAVVITGKPGLMTKPAANGTCDGGPLYALDLDTMRAGAATRARVRYGKYREAVEGTPDALPWSVFRDNISEGSGYTADQARAEYRSQPRVRALDATEKFSCPFSGDPIAEFTVPEEVYAERARAGAVPGYATLTADGRWMAPGHMGWFGMSDDEENDRIGYLEAANAYIGSLPDSAWIISVDCHI